MKILLFFLLIFFARTFLIAQHTFSYKEIDGDRAQWTAEENLGSRKFFGLDAADANKDGYLDIVSGRYFYLSPGNDLSGEWKRTDLGFDADGCLLMNINDNDYADIIAMKYPDVLWLEATDLNGTTWKGTSIARIPETDHGNAQGYARADIFPGGKPEILLAGGDGIYCIEIIQEEQGLSFNHFRIIATRSEEGFATEDIDKDKLPDIIFSNAYPGETSQEPVILQWAKNPGAKERLWQTHTIDITEHAIDRIEAGDINNDGITDIVVTEERLPGNEPDANMYWFKGNLIENTFDWDKQQIVTQYSMNNLDLKDIDRDGDLDIITSEHKGERLSTQIWLNNGKGNFRKEMLDTGKEMHLGSKLYDLDNDGDMDIIGHAWDNEEYLHMWRNDLIKRNNNWKHISTEKGDLERPNKGDQQTSGGLLDMDKDGIPEIFIVERTKAPSVVAYKFINGKWKRYIVDNEALRIEAGFALMDVDGDGDKDLIFGGDSGSNEVWWWKNPYPEFNPGKPWKRYTIKKTGKNKHHDILADDFTGDDNPELVFWNQGAGKLFIASPPPHPERTEEWPLKTIYRYHKDNERSKYCSEMVKATFCIKQYPPGLEFIKAE